MRISQLVQERRQERRALQNIPAEPPADETWWQAATRWVVDALETPDEPESDQPITLAEELDDHVVFESLSLEAVAEIEGHADRYAGVRILQRSRRRYPAGSVAAHLLGHFGAVEENELASDDYRRDDQVGRMGIERRCEALLRGQPGLSTERLTHGGQLLSTEHNQPARAGRDLMLTVDMNLQRTAESLLDSALVRYRSAEGDSGNGASGGAIVILDVGHGEVLTAASSPRFDPNVFIKRDSSRLRGLLADPHKPLFDRTIKMAIPPGSVFKTLSAVALLESGTVEPQQPFFC